MDNFLNLIINSLPHSHFFFFFFYCFIGSGGGVLIVILSQMLGSMLHASEIVTLTTETGHFMDEEIEP